MKSNRKQTDKDFIEYKDGNMFPEPISAERALQVLREFFLGDDWYTVNPVSTEQAYVYMVDNILAKYPRKYKKFCKKKGWRYDKRKRRYRYK